MLDKN
jgi:hypothetical protein